MIMESNGLRLRIYIGEGDRCGQRPLYEAIVLKAREAGLLGATVFRSPMGFGATSRLHTAKVLNLSTDLPIVIEMVDSAPSIEAFLPTLQGMLRGGLATTDPVRIVYYGSRSAE